MKNSWQLIAALAVFLTIGLVGCRGSDSSNEDATKPELVTGGFWERMPEGHRTLPDSAPEFQRKLLEDGMLTFEEYEKAVMETVRCMRDAGITFVTEPRLGPGKKYTYTTSLGMTADSKDSLEKKRDDCYNAYQHYVDIAWTYQNLPTEETRREAREAFVACLREAEVELPDVVPPGTLRTAPEGKYSEFHACQERVKAEYDIFNIGD